MRRPRKPRRVLRARSAAINIVVSATPPFRCSGRGWGGWTGPPAPRPPATGMAAVSSVFLSGLKTGDHVVAAKAMFGSCRHVVETILPRFGIASTLVDGGDVDQWQQAVRPETK